ncbi:hypothetical protein DIPPA_08277 [Diplonema papillatum]|nr:hypothetical protein DIPPA_08277 [Diplonema papillatum]
MVFDAKSKKAKFALKKAQAAGGAPPVGGAARGLFEPMPSAVVVRKLADNRALAERLREEHEKCPQPSSSGARVSVPDTGAAALQPGHNRLSVPLMSESEVAPCTVPLEEATRAPERLRSVLSEYGFALVTGVCSPKECSILEEMWQSDLLALAAPAAETPGAYPPFVRDAFERVGKSVENWPAKTLFENKFSDKRGLQHGCFAWSARLHPNVQSVFRSYYTALKEDLKVNGRPADFDPNDLCVGIDNTFFEPTKAAAGANDRYWMHADFNSNAQGANEFCVQGVLYTWDATSPRSSTTVILPRSATKVFDQIMGDDFSKNTPAHYIPHLRLVDESLRDALVERANRHARRIPCPAGSLLLWSSKAAHQGWSIGQRLAQPVCWQPKFDRPIDAYRKKLWLCLAGLPSTHWATIGKLHNTEQTQLVTDVSRASPEQPGHTADLLLPLYPMLVPYGIRDDKIDEWRRVLPQVYPGNPKHDWANFKDAALAEALLKDEIRAAL